MLEFGDRADFDDQRLVAPPFSGSSPLVMAAGRWDPRRQGTDRPRRGRRGSGLTVLAIILFMGPQAPT
jgi:hypothetical protein